jgi:hypothetical protein
VIDVVRDAVGVQKAVEEILEEDYARSRIEQDSAGADEDTRDRMAAKLPRRTLSPGYYEFALHLLRLESRQKTGVVYAADKIAVYEAAGLLAIGRARAEFSSRHPTCAGCGAHLPNRFSVECPACGAKLGRRK